MSGWISLLVPVLRSSSPFKPLQPQRSAAKGGPENWKKKLEDPELVLKSARARLEVVKVCPPAAWRPGAQVLVVSGDEAVVGLVLFVDVK